MRGTAESIQTLVNDRGERPLVTPFKPKPGRGCHSKGNLLHREGKGIKDAKGNVIAREGENIRSRRGSICGLRDKMALAGSSAKINRFVYTNSRVDSQLERQDNAPSFTPLAPAPGTPRRPRWSYRLVDRIR